jgi:thermostable 8-oxoguanine DNA glycosylase
MRENQVQEKDFKSAKRQEPLQKAMTIEVFSYFCIVTPNEKITMGKSMTRWI